MYKVQEMNHELGWLNATAEAPSRLSPTLPFLISAGRPCLTFNAAAVVTVGAAAARRVGGAGSSPSDGGRLWSLHTNTAECWKSSANSPESPTTIAPNSGPSH